MTKTNTTAIAGADVDVAVNGPDGVAPNWESIDWHQAEDNVRRLRQRIFSASKAGDLKAVRNLQKLMLRCRSNTLVSVRQVTQRNAGRTTPGIDGKIALTPRAKYKLVVDAQRQSKPQAKAVRRVHIPKSNGKQRPLGIPVIFDRVQQARVKNALEPEWEAKFGPRTYGFRPGRSCQDAIGAIYSTCNGKGGNVQRQWILDADLTAAFDTIDHKFLLQALGTFPARDMIAAWLKAGVIENGRFSPTNEGTPQGGVISPTLLNIALHGLEVAAGVRYDPSKENRVRRDSPVAVIYADDFVVFCHSRDQALQIKTNLAEWLGARGLSLNEDKTNIVNLSTGFDFLGFNIRQYRNRVLLITPSKAATKRIRKRLSDEMRSLRGSNVAAVLAKINPIVRGWTAYYRSVVASEAFCLLDDHMWRLTYKWAKRGHGNKTGRWITSRYYGQFNKSSNNRWVFGDHDGGAYLFKFAWTKIVRHPMVKGAASPDNRDLMTYWADRRRKQAFPPLKNSTLDSLKSQRGKCSLCGNYLLAADEQPQSPQEWEQWMRVTNKAIRRRAIVGLEHAEPGKVSYRLVHTGCYRRHNIDGNNAAFLQNADEP